MKTTTRNYKELYAEDSATVPARSPRKALWGTIIGGLVVLSLVLLVAVVLLSIFLGIADSGSDNNSNSCAVNPMPAQFYARAQVSGPAVIPHDKQWWVDSKQGKEATIYLLKNGETLKIIKDHNTPGVQYVFNSKGACAPLHYDPVPGFVAQSTQPSGTWTNPQSGVVCDLTTATRHDGSQFLYATNPKTGALCFLEEPGSASTVLQEFSTDPSMTMMDFSIPASCKHKKNAARAATATEGGDGGDGGSSSDSESPQCSSCQEDVTYLIELGVGEVFFLGCGFLGGTRLGMLCANLADVIAQNLCYSLGCAPFVCNNLGQC